MARYDAQNGAPGSTKFNPTLDALAPGGPAVPEQPSSSNPNMPPSASQCQTYTKALNRWAAYQNSHRPSGAMKLPTQLQQFYIQSACQQNMPG